MLAILGTNLRLLIKNEFKYNSIIFECLFNTDKGQVDNILRGSLLFLRNAYNRSYIRKSFIDPYNRTTKEIMESQL
jgi:hypothetical protein